MIIHAYISTVSLVRFYSSSFKILAQRGLSDFHCSVVQIEVFFSFRAFSCSFCAVNNIIHCHKLLLRSLGSLSTLFLFSSLKIAFSSCFRGGGDGKRGTCDPFVAYWSRSSYILSDGDWGGISGWRRQSTMAVQTTLMYLGKVGSVQVIAST